MNLMTRNKKTAFNNIEETAFKRKYECFKSLLQNNNKALSLINNLEDIILEHRRFHYDEIVWLCQELISTVYDITEDINTISGGKYPELFNSVEKIGNSILREYLKKTIPDRTGCTIPLTALCRDNHDQVGNKAANLGEIFNRVNLPTPRGFAITAFASHQFLSRTGLDIIISHKIKGIDITDTEELNLACDEIKSTIMASALPEELEKCILNEVAELENEFGPCIRLAVRSSATGEDSESSSFAGQHNTLLNVDTDGVISAYKDVVASTFNPRAVFYHRSKGYRDIDVIMSVLCLIMVDSLSSGVLYSVSPTRGKDDDIYISANWGLGVSIVDGSMPTDFWQYSRTEKRIVHKEIPFKSEMLVMDPAQGITRADVPGDYRQRPCLDEQQMTTLIDYGLRLERHFGWPVDMEWTVDRKGKVFILQARPLKRIIQEEQVPLDQRPADTSGYAVICEGGMTAFSGTVSGPAYHVESEYNLGAIPEGAILVADHTSPLLVSSMSRIAGIITDVGSVAGHMSSVAREFQIPALVGTGNATKVIPNYEMITLDASEKKVYSGVVHGLLKKEKKSVNLMKDSPVHRLVSKNLKKVVPLTLIDPKKENFSPQGCSTLHDIVRFAHEMAMQSMFSLGENISPEKFKTIRLKTELPLTIYILDLGGGLDMGEQRPEATAEDISSVPFKTLLRGMSNKEVRWTGPIGIDFSRHASKTENGVGGRAGGSPSPSYAIISGEYLNFNGRSGYHFVTLDAYCSDHINDNYITFSFKGGAADAGPRIRRAVLISSVLKKLGFRVDQKGDMVRAEMKKYDRKRMETKIDYIGRLLGSVRLLDMVLTDDQDISWYVEEFLRGNYVFAGDQPERSDGCL